VLPSRHPLAACAAALLTLSLFHPGACARVAHGVSPNLVISQVYGGGGNSGAPFTHDFVELYNAGVAPVALTGLSIQYASATGTGNFGANSGQLTDLPSVSVQPGQYFLVQMASGGANGAPLPTADFVDTTPINMSGTAGKVVLVTGTASLGCNGGSAPCDATALSRIVDLVGYGNANFFEGTAAPAPSNATSVIRTAGNVDTDQNGTDFLIANPPTPRTGGSVGGTPTVSVTDASVTEGDSGAQAMTFTVNLSAPAPVGGVSYSVATTDGTATAGVDYAALSLAGQTIAEGASSATHVVTVFGDTEIEPSETFTIGLSSVTGANAGDLLGVGTIANDDIALTAIHTLQGSGITSPFAGQDVATKGIVTAHKANGFFLQTPDGDADELSETSQGIFVFTGTAPTVAVGDEVRVAGRLTEFRRTSDVTPDTLTEIGGGVAVTVLSTGNPLPKAIDAASGPTMASSRNAQLERYEGMRMFVGTLAVVAPTTQFGELYGVVPGLARPFREPGIDIGDVLPAEAPASVPRFDGNYERIMVDTDEALDGAGERRAPLVLSTGAIVDGVAGPLDYAFDNYRISLDAGAGTVTSPGRVVASAPVPVLGEITVSALNVQNFFPPNPNVPSQVEAFNNRLTKATRVIVDVLRTPDVLGLIEMGDIGVLGQLRDRINQETGLAYAAYLLEADPTNSGNDQDIGYLVNLARVTVLTEPYQVFQGETFTIAGVTDTLFDRPPFVLEARINGVEVTVLLNHLKSLIEVNSNEPFGNGTVTLGQRNREKRRLGAESLADLIASRQSENLIVIGDMNAFEFNDGYVDVIGILRGSPAPADQVTAPSVDRWTHELVNLADPLGQSERYSYVFDGNAQVLDHVLVNQGMLQRLTRFSYTRSNADFPAAFNLDPARPERLSDHDAPLAYFAALADVGVSVSGAASVVAGTEATISMVVSNAGPDAAGDVVANAILPASIAWTSTAAPDGWSCQTAADTVTCRTPSLGAGVTATFQVAGAVQCALADGTPVAVGANVISSTTDLGAGNNSSAFTTSVSNPPPVISSAAAVPSVLWLPLHQMVPVQVSYTVGDSCGDVATGLAVTSDEPVTGSGQGLSGFTSPDWLVIDAHRVRLRAERALNGDGRVYTITITATDSAGGSAAQTVTVAVPRR
jgi:uncharacterized protein